MDDEGQKPWQPVWLPVALLLAVGVSVAVYMAPPELQKGFLPGNKQISKKQTAARAAALETKTLSCDGVTMSTIEQCQTFDIAFEASEAEKLDFEKIEFQTQDGVLYEISPENQSPKVLIQKTGRGCKDSVCFSTYAFRVITPVGLLIEKVRFVKKGGNSPEENGFLTIRLNR